MANTMLEKLYVEVQGDGSKLEKDFDKYVKESEKSVSKIEKNFQAAKLHFSDTIARKNITDVEKDVNRLKSLLEKKMAMNADLGTLTAIKERIDMAENAMREFQRATEDPAFLKESQVMAQLKDELLEVAQATELTSASTADYIRYNEMSEASVKQLITGLQKEQSALAIGSDAYKKHQTAIVNLTGALERLQAEHKTLPAQAGQVNGAVNKMNMAFGQLGFMIGDADMFMYNFRTGMMSIANNVPMVVQGLSQVKAEAEATGQSFKTVLAQSIMGAGGVMLGINALMFALNVLPGLLSDTTVEVKKQGDELEKLANKYDKLTLAQLKSQQSKVQTELSQMTSELGQKYGEPSALYKAFEKQMSVIPWPLGGLVFPSMSEDENKKYNALLLQNQALTDQIAKTGYLKDIDNTLLMLEEKRLSLPEKYKNAFDEQIKHFKRLKQENEKSVSISDTDTKKVMKAAEELAGGLDKASDDYYDKQLIQINKQADEFLKMGQKEVDVQKWVTEQVRNLYEDTFNARREAQDEEIQALRESLAKTVIDARLKKSGGIEAVTPMLGNLFGEWGSKGMTGFGKEDMDKGDKRRKGNDKDISEKEIKEWREQNEMLANATQDTINSITSEWNSAVGSWISGQQSFADATTHTWRNMANNLGAIIMDLVMKWALFNGLSLIPGFGGSGIGKFIGANLGFGSNSSVRFGGSGDSIPTAGTQPVSLMSINVPKNTSGSEISSGMMRIERAIQILNANMTDRSTNGRIDGKFDVEGKLKGNDIYLSNKKISKVESRIK